jgi:hypothetical protein
VIEVVNSINPSVPFGIGRECKKAGAGASAFLFMIISPRRMYAQTSNASKEMASCVFL